MATADTSDLGAVSEAAQASTDTPDGNPVSQELEKDQEANGANSVDSDIPAPYRFSSCEHCTKTVHAGHGRLLDCFHVVCGNCLGGLLRYDGTLVCPKCRKRTSRAKEQQRLGRSLVDLLPRVGIPFRSRTTIPGEEERQTADCCADCKDMSGNVVPGTHWCAECEDHFCSGHADEHRRRRATKSHVISLFPCRVVRKMRAIFSKMEIQNAKKIPQNFFKKCKISPKMQEKFVPLPWQPRWPPYFGLGSWYFYDSLYIVGRKHNACHQKFH